MKKNNYLNLEFLQDKSYNLNDILKNINEEDLNDLKIVDALIDRLNDYNISDYYNKDMLRKHPDRLLEIMKTIDFNEQELKEPNFPFIDTNNNYNKNNDKESKNIEKTSSIYDNIKSSLSGEETPLEKAIREAKERAFGKDFDKIKNEKPNIQIIPDPNAKKDLERPNIEIIPDPNAKKDLEGPNIEIIPDPNAKKDLEGPKIEIIPDPNAKKDLEGPKIEIIPDPNAKKDSEVPKIEIIPNPDVSKEFMNLDKDIDFNEKVDENEKMYLDM